VDEEERGEVEELFQQPGELSLRTRETDETKVILVLKASLGDDSSSNGVARKECEVEIPLTLEELNEKLLTAAHVQAKWSRWRKEYEFEVKKGLSIHVTLDKNTGYGFLTEFEMMVAESDVAEARAVILATMKELGVEELPQDRLERMFAYYNEHWREYYGKEGHTEGFLGFSFPGKGRACPELDSGWTEGSF
jgi:adenylate cyclase class IV